MIAINLLMIVGFSIHLHLTRKRKYEVVCDRQSISAGQHALLYLKTGDFIR